MLTWISICHKGILPEHVLMEIDLVYFAIDGVEKSIAKEYAHMKGLKYCFGLRRI